MEQHPLLKAVQESFGINPSLRTRRREVVDVRFAIMVAMRKRGKLTYHQIAKMFQFPIRVDGKLLMKPMSHCTVLHAIKQHEVRYHESPTERMFMYHQYCEVYDYCVNFLNDPKFTPTTVTALRESVLLEQMHRKEVEQNFENYKVESAEKVKSLEQYIKKIDREYAKLLKEKEHISRAFKQLYNEKKARNEQMVQEAGA